MKTVFDELRHELQSVDHWLDEHLKRPLPSKDRQLATSLKEYIAHCYRDKRKWRSESAANLARIKVAAAWGQLYLRNAKRQP